MVDEDIAYERAYRAYERMRLRHPDEGWPIIPKRRWLAELDGRAMIVSGYHSTMPMVIEGLFDSSMVVPCVRYRVTADRTTRMADLAVKA